MVEVSKIQFARIRAQIEFLFKKTKKLLIKSRYTAEPYGKVVWQSHMAKPYGRAIWQPRPPPRPMFLIATENFFRNFDPEKLHVRKSIIRNFGMISLILRLFSLIHRLFFAYFLLFVSYFSVISCLQGQNKLP